MLGFIDALIPKKLLYGIIVGLLLTTAAGAVGTLWYRAELHAQIAAEMKEAARHNAEVADLLAGDKSADLAAMERERAGAVANAAALERQLARIQAAQRTGRDAPAAPVLVEAYEGGS